MSLDLNKLSDALKKAADEEGADVRGYKLGKSDYDSARGTEIKVTFDHRKKTYHITNA